MVKCRGMNMNRLSIWMVAGGMFYASLSIGADVPEQTEVTPEQLATSLFQPGQLSLGARFGDVQEYVVDALVPIWKPSQNIFFLNMRGSALEDKAQELNAGLVVRHLLEDRPVILGANVYYDTRWTEENNTFDQVGAGVELLSKWIDMRANYYYPLTDEKTLTEFQDVTTSRNGRKTTTTSQWMRTYEEALEGFDAEIGGWLPYLNTRLPTALFVGYYDFSSDFDQGMSGVKLRLESRIHPNVTLDAEWYDDAELNQTDYFVGLRVHLPLDFWNGVDLDRKEGTRVRSFESRMSDMVYRDFRIRTVETGPILANRIVTEVTAQKPDAPAPEPPPPPLNCELIDGEVVCH